MQRDLFSDEHELFRAQFRRFAEAEIAPKIEEGLGQTWLDDKYPAPGSDSEKK